MVFAEDLGSLAIKSHARNQVKIASETVEIDSLHYEEKELLFFRNKTVCCLIATVLFTTNLKLKVNFISFSFFVKY